MKRKSLEQPMTKFWKHFCKSVKLYLYFTEPKLSMSGLEPNGVFSLPKTLSFLSLGFLKFASLLVEVCILAVIHIRFVFLVMLYLDFSRFLELLI